MKSRVGPPHCVHDGAGVCAVVAVDRDSRKATASRRSARVMRLLDNCCSILAVQLASERKVLVRARRLA